jgi:hypothetical protein
VCSAPSLSKREGERGRKWGPARATHGRGVGGGWVRRLPTRESSRGGRWLGEQGIGTRAEGGSGMRVKEMTRGPAWGRRKMGLIQEEQKHF